MLGLFEEGERDVYTDLVLSRGEWGGMIVDRIEITYGRKFNIGDYNSLELRCSLSGPLGSEESVEGAARQLFDKAKSQVREEYLLLITAMDNQSNG